MLTPHDDPVGHVLPHAKVRRPIPAFVLPVEILDVDGDLAFEARRIDGRGGDGVDGEVCRGWIGRGGGDEHAELGGHDGEEWTGKTIAVRGKKEE